MTRKGPRKSVATDYWKGRLDSARSHRSAARDALALAEAQSDGRAIVSLVVLAAIAYGDVLTARRANVINQQDHALAPRLLRDILRGELSEKHANIFRSILALKDEANYGARAILLESAARHFRALEVFAMWAEELLQSRNG